jgi:hypothetical protein
LLLWNYCLPSSAVRTPLVVSERGRVEATWYRADDLLPADIQYVVGSDMAPSILTVIHEAPSRSAKTDLYCAVMYTVCGHSSPTRERKKKKKKE